MALALARPLLEGCFGLSPPGRTWTGALPPPPPPPPPPPQTKPAFGLRVEEKQLHPSRTLGHCHPRLPLMLDPPTKPTCLSVVWLCESERNGLTDNYTQICTFFWPLIVSIRIIISIKTFSGR